MKPLFPARVVLFVTGLCVLLSPDVALSEKALREQAAFTVTTTADSDDGDCTALDCSLREAINAANANAGADTISFNVGGTIMLTAMLPEITDPGGLTISAQSRQVTISGEHAAPILRVADGARLTVRGLALIRGNNEGSGGAINNAGLLTVDECTFSENQAQQGGAIYSYIGSSLPIEERQLSVTRSTFHQNSAAIYGGAIYQGTGVAKIENCTIAGNYAMNGAALANGSGWTINVSYSTIAGNATPGGGTVYNASGMVSLRGSIVAGATSGANCAGAVTNYGHNLDSGSSCGWGASGGSLSDTDPMLGALASYGGPTDTMALKAGSLAINAGEATGFPAVDQRGVPRPFGPACDIGAFEYAGEASGVSFLYLLLD